jgi:bis(5'-nucleosyl)-tetraphosphatase (symmetrical)
LATWAIGDIQGCDAALDRLLKTISFDSQADRLWLVGDLVGRGPDSLAVLDRLIDLGPCVVSVLGNHDLHFLAVAAGVRSPKAEEKLDHILAHPSLEKYVNFLKNQSLIHVCPKLDAVMVHAGVYPKWTVDQAVALASEVADALRGAQCEEFLCHMYGDTPRCWDPTLSGWERLRFITNTFTRMRVVDQHGCLDLNYKDDAAAAPSGLTAWFNIPNPGLAHNRVVFGHWAASGLVNQPPYLGLDTGCIWGGSLSAVHLEAGHVNIVSVSCDPL